MLRNLVKIRHLLMHTQESDPLIIISSVITFYCTQSDSDLQMEKIKRRLSVPQQWNPPWLEASPNPTQSSNPTATQSRKSKHTLLRRLPWENRVTTQLLRSPCSALHEHPSKETGSPMRQNRGWTKFEFRERTSRGLWTSQWLQAATCHRNAQGHQTRCVVTFLPAFAPSPAFKFCA